MVSVTQGDGNHTTRMQLIPLEPAGKHHQKTGQSLLFWCILRTGRLGPQDCKDDILSLTLIVFKVATVWLFT